MSQPAFNFKANSRPAPIAPGQYRGPQPDPRPNRYGGKCHKCGFFVQEGAGYLGGTPGAWTTEHKPGECPSQQQVVEAVADPKPKTQTLPDATYTVEWQDGSYKTLRVRTQDAFETFMPGRQIVSFLSGSDNTRDYTQFAHVDERTGEIRIWSKHKDSEILREAVKVLLGNPKAASQAYAVKSERCSRCQRELTVPASIHAGMGPDCAEKVGW